MPEVACTNPDALSKKQGRTLPSVSVVNPRSVAKAAPPAALIVGNPILILPALAPSLYDGMA